MVDIMILDTADDRLVDIVWDTLLAMVDVMILDTADDRLVDIVWDTLLAMVDDIMEVEDTPAVALTNTM